MLKKMLNSFLDIPRVRDGKASVDALLSYKSDCEMYRKMVSCYFIDPSQGTRLLNEWSRYIQMREAEDFCLHSDSDNRTVYNCLMQQKNETKLRNRIRLDR